jgi:AcrR family transcriptional regulator
MAGTQRRRIGRPPASSSADTRQRILDVARAAFAELGYAGTTMHDIARKAGITTGALYHYFDSKLELYGSVYDEVQRFVFQAIDERVRARRGFLDQFDAYLNTALTLNKLDPSLAQFLGAARVDLGRHDELRQVVATSPGEGSRFRDRLVTSALADGVIDEGRADHLDALIRVLTVGLVDGVSHDTSMQALVIDAISWMMRAGLVPPGERR